ncbi:MAG: aminotransferase class I/II-fold pyridoxal phosphate-dependent enzyme, partial [Firmicutes bacterium]|nr:aminotransferase class I/II-fold pyridoxal phosphate-dependent enzyme [Bacillota bacterium]
MELSERAKQFKISGIRVLFDKAEKYQNTINFGIGEPGFRPPQNVIDKTAWALNNGYTKYVSNAGILPLREAIAKRSREVNGLDCGVSNVHVFVGATHALLMAMLSILNPGDDILIPCPYYAAYIGMVDMAEAHIVDVPVYEKDKFHVKAENLEKFLTPKTKAVLINS